MIRIKSFAVRPFHLWVLALAAVMAAGAIGG
jgi:hypothetical protein